MTMPEILRRKLMERIDIASEPDDGEVLEEIDRLILGEEETRYLPVAQKAELRRQLFYSVRRLDVLQELLEDAGITEIMVNGYQHIFVERRRVMETLISEIQIYEDRQPNGQWLKSIKFKLPIIEEDMEISLDNDTHVEVVCSMVRVKKH